MTLQSFPKLNPCVGVAVALVAFSGAIACGVEGGGGGPEDAGTPDLRTDLGADSASSDSSGAVDSMPGGDMAQADVPACNIEPTLTSLKENYFAASCNFGSCHSSAKAGGLDLTGDVHAALVNAPAVFPGAAAKGKVLVIPGDPDNSYFLQKLEGPDDGEGAIMPFGAQEPMDPNCRIEMVRQWIAAGANP